VLKSKSTRQVKEMVSCWMPC